MKKQVDHQRGDFMLLNERLAPAFRPNAAASAQGIRARFAAIVPEPPQGCALKVVRNRHPRSPSLIRQRTGSRLRSCCTVEDSLTRVRQTSYGSQPDRGRVSPSKAFTIPVNSSFAAGDTR